MQRAVLARELGGEVEVLVAANPCFGLDFHAVAEIRSQIMQARNRGAAVLLVSEDLDEILELADRVLVISDGRIVYETPIKEADRQVIGRHMAGHGHSEPRKVDASQSSNGMPKPIRRAKPYDYHSTRPPGAGRDRHAARFPRAGRFRRSAGQRRKPCCAPIVPNVARLLAAFREQGLTIVHTKECHRPDLSDCPPAKRAAAAARCGSATTARWAGSSSTGEPGNDFVPPLRPLPGEMVLAKPGKGRFYATELQEELQSLGITHSFITGVTTEVCVQTTMREANDRGYECLLVEDAHRKLLSRVQAGDPGHGPGPGRHRRLDRDGRHVRSGPCSTTDHSPNRTIVT